MKAAPLAAAFALVLAPGLFAAHSWSWSTSLDTIVGAGDTRYLMEEVALGVSSELVFPLNTLLMGVTFRGDRAGEDGERKWGLEASVAVNLLAPFGKMEDYDWWMDYYYPKAAFSYTESEATMFFLTASVAWKPLLARGGWGELEAVFGYRMVYIYQEAHGYLGWRYEDADLDGQWELRSVQRSESQVVLTYRILWNATTAGLSVTLRPVPAVTVTAEAGLAGAYVADRDYHVLRYKLSTASGLGFGGYAGLGASYSWGKAGARVRPFLSLAGSALGLKADTDQTQTYYAGATEAPPGTSSPPLDHQISTRLFAVTLAGGVRY